MLLKYYLFGCVFGLLVFETSLTLQITFTLSIHHAQTSLFVNCAGGSQGVQLLDGSNTGQVRAIGLR